MVVLVLTMVRDRAEAERISEALVSERLAACVSSIPGATSVYRWREEVERSREVMLIAKTSSRRLRAVMHRMRELHSYELPEVLAVRVDRGLPEYLKWVEESLV